MREGPLLEREGFAFDLERRGIPHVNVDRAPKAGAPGTVVSLAARAGQCMALGQFQD